jgi:hypothetical protein
MADDRNKFRSGIHRAEERAGLTEMSAEATAMSEGAARIAEQGSTLARDSLRGFSAVSDAGLALAGTMQELSREMVSIVEDGWRHQVDGLTTMASCRTMPELMAAQAAFAKQTLDRTMQAQRRLAGVVMRQASATGEAATSATKAASAQAAA